ncbi:MAG: GFA family protein [Sneathiella sp.]
MDKIYRGSCLCGHITFEVAGEPENPHTCSCSICQKHSGAPTVNWVEYSAEAVKWTGAGGTPATFRSSPDSSRAFCPKCGSTIGAIDDEPVIAFVTGCFSDGKKKAFKPAGHSYRSNRPKWWHLDIGD